MDACSVPDRKGRGKISVAAARKALDSAIWAPLRRGESIVDRYRYYRDMDVLLNRKPANR